MRSTTTVALFFCLLAAFGCGNGNDAPSTPTPAGPTGTIRLLGATVPDGSTLTVAPMSDSGQQVPALSFRVAMTVSVNVSPALVRAFVRNETMRCLGGGAANLVFGADEEQVVESAGMSNDGSGQPVCPLPFTTTFVEVELIGNDFNNPLLLKQFPAIYHFVAE
jgi:hypothetical protein